MELIDLFPTKTANALNRGGIFSVETLKKIFASDPKRIRNFREIGDIGFATIEYVLKVELP